MNVLQTNLGFIGAVASMMTLVIASHGCAPSAPDTTRIDHAQAIDGDTFRQDRIRYRIASIDAPELPGHCRGYRAAHNQCALGDPYRAKDTLQFYLDQGIYCHDLGADYYRRRLVDCNTAPDDRGADLGQLLIQLQVAQPYEYKGPKP